MKTYLDFNSTHPPLLPVLEKARTFYLNNFANSSGLSLASQQVNARIEEARTDVAALFQISPSQIIFTSCATESNNLLIREFRNEQTSATYTVFRSAFEHPSIVEPLKILPGANLHTEAQLEEYDLLCMMAVQNESGVILPVAEEQTQSRRKICDFSQALPKLASDAEAALTPSIVRTLTERNFFLTATGHKLGAGFGAGLIITPPDGLKGAHLLAGGNQEHTLRAGSHNLEAIITLAEALKYKLATNSHKTWQAVTQNFEALLIQNLSPLIPAKIIGAQENRAPGTTLLLLPGVPIDFLIMGLDQEGITVSTGTSCKSRSRTPSEAVIAMGYTEAEALSVMRMSYDQNLSAHQITFVVETLTNLVKKLSALAG